MRVWKDAATGLWYARFGTEPEYVEERGNDAYQAMMLVQLGLKATRYQFDATARSL